MMISALGTVVMMVFSVTSYFTEKKENKEKNIKRKEVYSQYLLNKRKELNEYKQNEIEALNYNNPPLSNICEMTKNFSPRIYERDINDDDFLSIKIGYCDDKPEFNLSFDYDFLAIEKDKLQDAAHDIYQEYATIQNKPIMIDLKKSHLGVVGEKKDIHQQLKNYLAQLSFFQSYQDVEIIMLYNKEYINDFDYIKWLPHNRIHSVNLSGNINNEQVKEQVLGSLYQIIKSRKLNNNEGHNETIYIPHYIIIVDDYHLLMNHAIMEYLQEDTTSLGFSLIYTAQKKANLPENIHTVLEINDHENATLLIEEGLEVNKDIKLEQINSDVKDMARNLSVLNHLKGITSHIPESITFLDMYKVKTCQELDILNRWETHNASKSLAVPLGLRGKDDIVELNLHEKAHGPHGLVAGTTGSGKSETIQSYILSLAVNFSPNEVGFLLIDYKGGGMANLFKELPHLLGTITNLDGAESMRALESIKAELKRRQNVFNEVGVNNINNYTKLYKRKEVKEPLPHLFIISDEFAELKKEQPEFMSELVSVARIGRTLGVHLILATQKPTGVVDDQIWSNSKFKLALKVQDEADSKEILKTPDAAHITQTGRAYLQVGNNEIYELFQSAWSGAKYDENEKALKKDNRIYKVNPLGQGELINQDLSDEEEDSNMVTQLDAIVLHIKDLYEHTDHQTVTKPWLPPLPDMLEMTENKLLDLNKVNDIDLDIQIGLIDIPERQTQEDYRVDFVEDGNLAVFSSSGFGKTFTIGEIIYALCLKNNPELVNMYILDFGNSSLMPYSNLPQVADYITVDNEEKLSKFTRIINQLFTTRKKLFGKEMVQSFSMYNSMNPTNKLPAIFIFIDNFDVVKEISLEFEEFMTKLTRDGLSLGIYTVISATRANAVRFATMNNFKNKIVEYMFDEGDVVSLIGRSQYKPSTIKGRALVKTKNINMMQIYTPFEFKDDLEFIENIKTHINEIKESYHGKTPLGIPVLPETLSSNDFGNYQNEDDSLGMIIGLSTNNVENVKVKFKDDVFLIGGTKGSGKTNLLKLLISQRNKKGKSYVFDSNSMELYRYQGEEALSYVGKEPDDNNQFLEELFAIISDRQEAFKEAVDNDRSLIAKEYFSTLDAITIFIDEASLFIARFNGTPNIVKYLNEALDVGVKIVATTNVNSLKGFDDITKLFKNTNNGILLSEQSGLNVFNQSIREVPEFGFGVLYEDGEKRKIRIAKYEE